MIKDKLTRELNATSGIDKGQRLLVTDSSVKASVQQVLQQMEGMQKHLQQKQSKLQARLQAMLTAFINRRTCLQAHHLTTPPCQQPLAPPIFRAFHEPSKLRPPNSAPTLNYGGGKLRLPRQLSIQTPGNFLDFTKAKVRTDDAEDPMMGTPGFETWNEPDLESIWYTEREIKFRPGSRAAHPIDLVQSLFTTDNDDVRLKTTIRGNEVSPEDLPGRRLPALEEPHKQDGLPASAGAREILSPKRNLFSSEEPAQENFPPASSGSQENLFSLNDEEFSLNDDDADKPGILTSMEERPHTLLFSLDDDDDTDEPGKLTPQKERLHTSDQTVFSLDDDGDDDEPGNLTPAKQNLTLEAPDQEDRPATSGSRILSPEQNLFSFEEPGQDGPATSAIV
jgi:hypothetical protein